MITDWTAHRASGVARVLLAPEVNQDLQALDRKVKEV